VQQFAQRDFSEVQQRALDLAVIIPVLNECDNVHPLLEKLAITLAGIEWEAIFVDDNSTDGTPERVEEIARCDSRVRLIRRFGRRGLSTAVVEGFLSSVAPVLAVIDGDMQHDEAALPKLYYAIAEGGADLAVGTRYAEGGSVGEWSSDRAFMSRFATKLASPITKNRLSDPMSGLFAINRDAMIEAAPHISGAGFKILLDLLASSPRQLKVAEVAYTFRTRVAGESKLDSAVMIDFLELLLEKTVGRWIPPKLIMFGAIGALGAGIHLSVLGLSFNIAAASFAVAQSLAVFTAMLFNFTLNNQFTYRDRRLTGAKWIKGFASFCLVCSLGAVANVGIGSVLHGQSTSWWLAGLGGAVVGSIWNYAATSWFTWSKR
jgi:dolichol-phosphate mannosyltransferase